LPLQFNGTQTPQAPASQGQSPFLILLDRLVLALQFSLPLLPHLFLEAILAIEANSKDFPKN
jgi:hypothetical protein